jgi:hypothetical protein
MDGAFPEYLKQGELARLIPVCAPNQKERAACSVLLAALRIVHPFARDLFGELKRRVGNWASIEAYTEVVFANQADENARHDGLLILNTRRGEWRALIEAKIGTAKIDPEQIKRYYRLARANQIDAIITISNELSPRPDHIPYDLRREELEPVQLYHWSWPYLGSVAEMLLHDEADFDEEQHFILSEVVRYLARDNELNYSLHMGGDWGQLMQTILADGHVAATDAAVLNSVRCWHQQQANVCIWLGRDTRRQVTTRLSRAHRGNQRSRLTEDAEEFVSDKRLRAVFNVAGLAGPLELSANALVRNLVCRLSVVAPEDRQRYHARVNWLIRQLPIESDEGTLVHISWDNGNKTTVPLTALRSDPHGNREDGALPKVFEVARAFDATGKFSGPQKFVEAVDNAIWDFYDTVARHIQAWHPSSSREHEELIISDEVSTPSEPLLAQPAERRVIQRGEFQWGSFVSFADGSIEIDMGGAKRWFRSFGELERAFKSGYPPANGSSEPDDPPPHPTPPVFPIA